MALAALALTACGGSTPGSAGADGEVTLQLWDTDTRPERSANLKQLIDMFEKKNPGIKVTYLGLPTDSYMQKIDTAIATKSTPDLLTPKASDLSALVAQGALAPLDDRFAKGGWAERVDRSMVDITKAAAPDGKLYMTPATSLADAVYYRKDWYDKVGLGAPASWNDFFTAAQKLTDKGSGRFGYTIRGGAGFFPQFVQMVYPQAGVASFFREDGTSTLDDPAVVEAAQKYVGLYKTATAESDLTADFKAMVAQFTAGGAGMLSHSIGSYPTITKTLQPAAVGVAAPLPAADGSTVLTGRVTTGFAMFNNSRHRDAAWKFLEFTMSQEGNSFWAKASGYIPGNLAVEKESWVQDSPVLNAAVAAGKAPNVRFLNQPYYLPEFNSITNTDMRPDWQRVLQGQLSVREFLTTWAAKLTQAQQRYQKLKK
ncbi:ABC transporter substrate-binding protein [Micromonospora olivasterospora]